MRKHRWKCLTVECGAIVYVDGYFYSGVVKRAEKAGKSILGRIGGFVVSGFVALVGKC